MLHDYSHLPARLALSLDDFDVVRAVDAALQKERDKSVLSAFAVKLYAAGYPDQGDRIEAALLGVAPEQVKEVTLVNSDVAQNNSVLSVLLKGVGT